jgi:hypothetical protein
MLLIVKASLTLITYCEQASIETQCSFTLLYSRMIIYKSSFYLYQITAGEYRVGSKQKREKERRRYQIRGERDRGEFWKCCGS